MKNCIIAGGSSGIGYQAARQIAEKGYHVTLLCRNQKRAEKAAAAIAKETGSSKVDWLIAGGVSSAVCFSRKEAAIPE